MATTKPARETTPTGTARREIDFPRDDGRSKKGGISKKSHLTDPVHYLTFDGARTPLKPRRTAHAALLGSRVVVAHPTPNGRRTIKEGKHFYTSHLAYPVHRMTFDEARITLERRCGANAPLQGSRVIVSHLTPDGQ